MLNYEATTSGAEHLCNGLQTHSLHARRVPASSAPEPLGTYDPSYPDPDLFQSPSSVSNDLGDPPEMTDEEKQEVPKPAPKPAKDQGYVQSWADHPIGYPRLSERMGAHNESMIFRKFSALNSRVLLYLQADLVQLENQLHAIERRDNKDNHGWRSKYATDFHWLQKSREDGCDHQLALIREIQGKLQTYNKMLLQTAQMNRIADPDRFDLTNMQNYLFSDEMGAGAMVGSDSLTWGQPSDRAAHAPDLLGLCARTTSDSFSRIVAENTVCFFRFGLGRLAPKDRHIGHEGYHDATVLRATLWITSFVASLLPILSIIVLIHLETLKAKLWTIAGFNVLISFCLNMFTEASRKDAFAVTAAFAAVQVVFVGTDSQPLNGA